MLAALPLLLLLLFDFVFPPFSLYPVVVAGGGLSSDEQYECL